MFRRLAAVICAAMLSICLVSCSMTEIPEKSTVNQTEVPPKMLFLGDSIASGYGLEGYTPDDNYHCRSYSNILKDRYDEELGRKCRHSMINKAVSGATSADFIEQLRSGELDSDLADCDAVVVSIGGNDLLDIMLELVKALGINEQGSFSTDELDVFGALALFLNINNDIDKALDQFEFNIGIISDELNKRTDGTVYIQTLYDPLEYFSSIKKVTDFSSEKLGRFNEIISTNSSKGYKVIDVASDFKGKAGTLTNISDLDIHPNAAGHEVIAEDVDAALRATGFTYTTTEYGKRQLTYDGKLAVCGIFAGLAFVMLISLIVLFRTKKYE